MLNNNVNGSRTLLAVISAVFFVGCGLASCGSGGGSSGSTKQTVTVSAVSASIVYNSSTTINWTSTNSTSCVSSSGSGGTGTTGSFNTGALTATTTYTVTCTGTAGSASGNVKITVAPPAISAFTQGSGNIIVTSVNSLSNGSVIIISGTTHYNGTYTVANVTSTSFTIVTTYGGDDATGTWQLAGGMIANCSTTGATSAITLSNLPNITSRFSGVAPLTVFFDASATTTTPPTTRPFHDLEYQWSFGENLVTLAALPSTANWINGSTKGSRNSATGPLAAHVFETPGAYIVTLTATDGTNTVSNSCAKIVVQDPDAVFSGTNTICFSTSGAFAACPTGATHVTTSNFQSAISTYQNTGKRLLFRSGETFTTASSATINKTGPGIVGAFDTGAQPIVQATAATTILSISGASTPTIKDWRVMDLEFDGVGSGTGADAIIANGGFNQFLALRLNGKDIQVGVQAHPSILNYWNANGSSGHTIYKEWAVVDSSFAPVSGTFSGAWRVNLAGENHVIMGNFLDNGGNGQHVIRSGFFYKGVIGNNTLAHAGSTQHTLKLHAPTWCDTTVSGTCDYTTDTLPASVTSVTGGYTELNEISDNKFIGAANAWTTALGPQNAQSDERVRDLIVERNWFVAGSGTQQAIISNAVESTFRNNICDMTGASSHTCFTVEQRGVEPPPHDVRIYNNTFYSSSTGNFIGVNISGSTPTNVSVINNLGSAASATTTPVMISGTGASGLINLNNLLNAAPATPDAVFVSSAPVNPVDFDLNATSPALDTGNSTIPVFSDFFRTDRPVNNVIDIGAVEWH